MRFGSLVYTEKRLNREGEMRNLNESPQFWSNEEIKNMTAILVERQLICTHCYHKFVWRSDELTVRIKMIYQAWMEMVMEHFAGCRGEASC